MKPIRLEPSVTITLARVKATSCGEHYAERFKMLFGKKMTLTKQAFKQFCSEPYDILRAVADVLLCPVSSDCPTSTCRYCHWLEKTNQSFESAWRLVKKYGWL